jgi:hypothetical protein
MTDTSVSTSGGASETTDVPPDGSPSDRLTQLQQLGQRVLDAVVAAYDPDGTSSLALALHPGQVIADDVVQGGVVNPLRLSTWLADQYDYPLWLHLADGTPIASTALGGITATSAYVTAARFAQPSLPVDAPAYPRIESLIADARQDIGTDPDALPFGAEPDDFPSPDCTAWQVFDTSVTTHEETSTTSTPDAGATPPPGRRHLRLNPELWRLRAVSSRTLEQVPVRMAMAQRSLTLSRQVAVLPQQEAVQQLRTDVSLTSMVSAAQETTSAPEVAGPLRARFLSSALQGAVLARAVEVAPAEPAPAEPAPAASSVAASSTIASMASVASVASVVRDHRTLGKRRLRIPTAAAAGGVTVDPTPTAEPAAPAEPAATVITALDPSVIEQLSHVHLVDLVGEPATSTVTTQDSELRVQFEFLAVTITRRLAGVRWWHPELLAEPSWYVPGMAQGALVPADDDPDRAWCLPTTLLLVRNVSLTGTWSQEAAGTMDTAVHYVGPFLMGPAQHVETASGEVQQSTMVGSGIQVIGELCTPLPPLPPTGDPGPR